jgi:dihydropteroate synthase
LAPAHAGGPDLLIMILRAGHHRFEFPRPTILMGIVNVTPDSFSDGGRYLDREAAIDRALQLEEEGAEFIDIGGESTRPHAAPVSEAVELRRVLPVVEGLAGRLRALISIDTYKPEVARQALQAGACLVNDVGANRENSAMWELVAQTGAGYVAMHMQGTPQTMQLQPSYGDVCAEVAQFLADRLKKLEAVGVDCSQTVLDVGIGFGKRREHNLELIARLGQFRHLDRPLLLGVSRKSFLAQGAAQSPAERLPAALAVSCRAVEAGVGILRTHDVRATMQAVRMTEEILQFERAAT